MKYEAYLPTDKDLKHKESNYRTLLCQSLTPTGPLQSFLLLEMEANLEGDQLGCNPKISPSLFLLQLSTPLITDLLPSDGV